MCHVLRLPPFMAASKDGDNRLSQIPGYNGPLVEIRLLVAVNPLPQHRPHILQGLIVLPAQVPGDLPVGLPVAEDPNNPNSGAVMRKCGMTYEATLRQADWNNQGVCDMCMYAISW